MLRDITLGQYYPTNSYIHKLDARVKIISSILFMTSLFMMKEFIQYIPVLLTLFLVIRVSKVPFKFLVKGLKPIMMVILFAFVINMILTPGEVVLDLKWFHITKEGFKLAFFMAFRLVLLIIGTSLLTLTTSPIELTDGLEKLLNPFKRIGVPAHELAMMMTIALRFIPTLLGETDKIMKAQMARGADFESGNIIKRTKNLIPLLVPLFISAFRRADELAMAMESRCYRGGDNRTRMKVLKMQKRDYVFIGMNVVYLAVIVAIGVL